MSQIGKIIWDDKSNARPVTDRTKQAVAEDFLEIKTVVNNCVDGINWIKSDEVALAIGVNHIAFNFAYPVGVAYLIMVHNCYNTTGYLIAHTITNKLRTGFDVTVSESGILTYMTVVKR